MNKRDSETLYLNDTYLEQKLMTTSIANLFKHELKKIALMPIVSLCCTIAFACTPSGPESESGNDKDRLGAIEIKINDLVIDHVTCIDHDKTDWKYFTVPTDGNIAVTFAFDQEAANGTVIIRKATGEELFNLPYKFGARMQQVFFAQQGHYYLEIFCDAFESEYTIEVSYQ